MSIDWSKAPEGFPIWLEDLRPSRLSAGDHDRSSWACEDQGEYTLYCLGGSRGWWTKSREGIDFVVHRQPEPWNGEGLPPVGTVCEFRIETDDWRQCEVIAHKDGSAVCWIHCNKIFATNGSAVRPIRTAEQIAADERAEEVKNMMALNPDENPNQALSKWLCEAIYDAGYRKQEATQ